MSGSMKYKEYVYNKSDSDEKLTININATRESNSKIFSDLKICKANILQQIKLVWGDLSEIYVYVASEPVPEPPNVPTYIEDRKNEQKLKNKKYMEYFATCVKYCIKNNLTWDDIDDVKSVAEDHLWDKIISDSEGTVFDCECEECGTWTANKSRCSCGLYRCCLSPGDIWSLDDPEDYYAEIY